VIVRILGEGQFRVPDAATDQLNSIDSEIQAALDRGEGAAFSAALSALLAQVRSQGSPLPADILEPSDLILPAEDSSMEEVRKLLTDEGLIPG
jgi:hypothetical protein